MRLRIQKNAKSELGDLLRYLKVHRFLPADAYRELTQYLSNRQEELVVERVFEHCVTSNAALPQAFWSQLARTASEITGDPESFDRLLAQYSDARS